METSAEDRFGSLFTSGSKPAPLDPTKPHLFEIEQQIMQQNSPWTIPEIAQYSRQVRGPAPKPAGGDDLFTSSEDDDYVSAFSKKPTMLSSKKKKKNQQKPKPRRMPEATARGYAPGAHIEAKDPIKYVPTGKSANPLDDEREDHEDADRPLPSSDKLGNSVTGHFCQFNLVKKFPYKYMVDANDRVSRHFFANNKFFERSWDLYYVHPPESLYRDVLLLLPYAQVLQLVNEIATTFKTEVSVAGFPLTLSFFDDGTPQPQLLGTTQSRADINEMQDSIPPPPAGHGEPPANASEAQDISFAAFKRKMEKAAIANKKNTAVKKKKAQDRFLIIQDWVKQLRRAQRYFGLRPPPNKIPEPDPNMTWVEQEAFIKQNEKKAGVVLDPLDITKPAPFAFEKEPVIVSIDIESYERNHGLITEIGVSTIDTLDLVAESPGRVGANWMKHIRSRHFRIKDREHYINKDFVRGHPDAFQFGESEFVRLEEAGKAVDSCFEWPFSIQYKHDGRLKNVGDDWDAKPTDDQSNSGASVATPEAVSTTSGRKSANGPSATDNKETGSGSENPSREQRGPRQRTILLLGHDLGTDLAYLTKLSSRVFSAPRPQTYPAPLPDPSDVDNPVHSILEALDTATLYKVFTRDTQTKSLTSIMSELGRTAWYAHNGGNDARYTLEALVGLIVKSRIQDDEEKAAKAAALKQALEKDTWNADSNGGTTPVAGEQDKPSATDQDEASSLRESLSQNDGTASPRPRSPSPTSPWDTETSRGLTDRLAAARREVEDENNTWDGALNLPHRSRPKSPSGPQSCDAVDVSKEVDEGGLPTPFSPTLQTTHASTKKTAHKKTAEEEGV